MRVESTKSDGAFVRAEMAEQPEVLERLLARREELRSELQLFKNKPLRGVILAARGSSDNAANYARYVLEASLGCPASLSANSLFTRYHCRGKDTCSDERRRLPPRRGRRQHYRLRGRS